MVPQDGRFKIEVDDKKISFRVSIIPVFSGEKVVMRIQDKSKKIPALKDLGITGTAFKRVEAAIKKPNGIILNTGPTGSGKTTTLYACYRF